MSIKEELKQTWKYYIPVVATTGLTITTIILNHKLSGKEIAAILGSAGLSTKLLNEYKQKIKEIAGDEAYDDINRAIAKDHEDGIIHAVTPCIDICDAVQCHQDVPQEGNELFYDMYSETWFRSSMEAVRAAEYHLNRNHSLGGCVPAQMFYEFLGLPIDLVDDNVGWGFQLMEDGIYWIDFEHTLSKTEDGEEYTIISFTWNPYVLTDED